MSIQIYGREYDSINGIKAWDTETNSYKSFISPEGTLNISSNGEKDVTSYASVNVNVPSSGATINNQDKTVSPSETQQIVTADNGHTGLGTVTVNAISSDYVGSAIDVNPTIIVAGKTVTIPKGYYSTNSQKAITDVDLIAGNVRKDIDIFGVVGTYEGTDHMIGVTQDEDGYLVLDDNDADLSTYVSSTGLLYTKKMTINIGMESSFQYLSTTLGRYGSMPELEELTLVGGITDNTGGAALASGVHYFPVSKYPKLKVLKIQPTSVSSGKSYFAGSHYCFSETNLTTLILGTLGGPYWGGAGYFRNTDENGNTTRTIGSTDGLTIIAYTNKYLSNGGFANGTLDQTTNIIEYDYLTGEQLMPSK